MIFALDAKNTSYAIGLKQPECTLPLVSATKYQTHTNEQVRQVYLLAVKLFSAQLWEAIYRRH